MKRESATVVLVLALALGGFAEAQGLRLSLIGWSRTFYSGAEGYLEVETVPFAVCEIITLRDAY